MRKGGAAIAYPIVVTVLLILRASAILSAPISPILLFHKLIQRERERQRHEKRKGGGCHCLPYTSDGVVDLESLGDLVGSNGTNIIMSKADSERERESDEMRRGRWGGWHC
jgi:hypothetical protein